MIKKTKIEKKLRRKTNPEIVETILAAKKNKSWLPVANKVSTPRRKQFSINLDQIDKQTKDNDVIVIPGKVLGTGEINKKIKIVALSYSESAKKKLEKSGVKFHFINEEIKNNPNAKNIKVINKIMKEIKQK